jgi:hypothetical protein
MNTLKTVGALAITSALLTACGAGDELDLDETDSVEEADSEADVLIRYYNYLSQAGFNNPSQLGSEKDVQACEVRVQQGSVTFNSGVTKSCVWQQSEPGWVVQSVWVTVRENKNNRGSYAYSVIDQAGQFYMDVNEIGNKWKGAIDASAKAGDVDAKAKLELEFEHHMQRIVNFSSNKNSVYLEATANGGLFQTSIIDVVATARLLKVE